MLGYLPAVFAFKCKDRNYILTTLKPFRAVKTYSCFLMATYLMGANSESTDITYQNKKWTGHIHLLLYMICSPTLIISHMLWSVSVCVCVPFQGMQSVHFTLLTCKHFHTL